MAGNSTPQRYIRAVLQAGVLYFVIVFGTGFVLGIIRVVWIVPAIGRRAAELSEMPVMLLTIILAARWVASYLNVPATRAYRLGMGLIGGALVLALDLTVVLWLRGQSFDQYVESFEPVAGTAYFFTLAIFSIMPALVAPRVPR